LPEKQLIRLIRRQASTRRTAAGVIATGIGDDSAVLRLPSNHEVVVTTDFSLEGTHFRREWHPPRAVGHRCLARGLSDIAAMGGTPLAAFLSLGLPARIPQTWVNDFLRGLLELARKFRVSLAGGDIAQSSVGVLADIVVLGTVPAGRAILRSGAKPGDGIHVTGALGASAATLARLRSQSRARIVPSRHPAHFFPEPRIVVGQFLSKKRLASAMIDVSDGLSTDLAHICEESGVGAVVYGDLIPLGAPAARGLSASPTVRADSATRASALNFALHGGEDYELLFTAPASARVPPRIAGVPITRIGEITRAKKMWLIGAGGRRQWLVSGGWEHFANPGRNKGSR
jgi:thiamine-monophosphate kinase